MKLHCPYCHAQFSIDALTQDEAARELLAMRAVMLPSLLPYLTLFRAPKRALAFDRAVKLAKEVMALSHIDPVRLEMALANTVEALRLKRDGGSIKPLKDHKYLQAVLESTRTEDRGTRYEGGLETQERTAPTSKTARAIGRLQSRKSG
jgi:hypothetical protein